MEGNNESCEFNSDALMTLFEMNMEIQSIQEMNERMVSELTY